MHMQKSETKAEVVLFSCEFIPFKQICMCYDKYNGIGDTLFGACFGGKRSKYHQKHTMKYPKKTNKQTNKINNYDSNNEAKQRNMNTHIFTWK